MNGTTDVTITTITPRKTAKATRMAGTRPTPSPWM